MNQLQRRALARVALSKETVQSFYDGTRSGTAEQCLAALCESHERLRAELEGAEALLADGARYRECLLRLAARADDYSGPCVRAHVADALGLTVRQLGQELARDTG